VVKPAATLNKHGVAAGSVDVGMNAMLGGGPSLGGTTSVPLNSVLHPETLNTPAAPVKPGSDTVMVSFSVRSTLEVNAKLTAAAVDVKQSEAGMLSAVSFSATRNRNAGEMGIGVGTM
jgi:hypothetical protein